MGVRRFIAEKPEEVRTPWFHAEFYLIEGIIRFRLLSKSPKGYHLIPGSLKLELNFAALRDGVKGGAGGYPRFFALLRLMLDRWDPTRPKPPST